MGASHMCVLSALGKYDAPRDPRGYDNAVRALRRVARRAADANVILGLEVVNRYETNVLNTAAQASTFVDEIGEPNVKVHLDSYHANIEEESLRRAVLTCGTGSGTCTSGSRTGGARHGHGGFRAALLGIGGDWVRGTHHVRNFSSRVASPDLSNTLCVWRDLWDDGETLARDARAYVLERLESAAVVNDPNTPKVGDWY